MNCEALHLFLGIGKRKYTPLNILQAVPARPFVKGSWRQGTVLETRQSEERDYLVMEQTKNILKFEFGLILYLEVCIMTKYR